MQWNKHRLHMEIFYRLTFCNPFSLDCVALERELLGRFFCNSEKEKKQSRIFHLAENLLKELRHSAVSAATLSDRSIELYESLAFFYIFHRYKRDFEKYAQSFCLNAKNPKALFFEDFLERAEYYLGAFSQRFFRPFKPAHWFAFSFQLYRAFHQISESVIGTSSESEALRSSIWQSIFTHDVRRHMTSCYQLMDDIPTLILGTPGSGKGKIAQIISCSRFIPFDAGSKTFAVHFNTKFSSVHFGALSAKNVELELFGNPGSNQYRVGLFENCGGFSTVYLNEIASADFLMQVRLLQVLQNRTFQRSGDLTLRYFLGKIVASSSLNLEREVQARRFRSDLFCGLRADVIKVPTLRSQLDSAPNDLQWLVSLIAQRIIGAEQAQTLTEQVMTAIHTSVGASYAWPGNIRELEQCVRHVMMHNTYSPYVPLECGVETSLRDTQSNVTADEVLARYCTFLYLRTGSYEEAARIAKLDRRTFKAKINESLMQELRSKI